MKKFFSFVAAALLSTAMFASRAVAPTAADLGGYATGTHTVAVYFDTFGDEAPCEGVAICWVGSVQGNFTATYEAALKFEPVENFAGWWVVSFNDASEDVQGKPICLKKDGSLDGCWDYQTGDVDSWELVSGSVEITAGYSGESNLGHWGAGINVLRSAYLKEHNNPCQAVVEHDYTVKMYIPDCQAVEVGIIGDFDGWVGSTAELNMDEGGVYYTKSFHDAEGHGFKPYNLTSGWAAELKSYDASKDEWFAFSNFKLGTETTITIDFTAPGEYAGQVWQCVAWQDCTEEADCVAEGIHNVFENAKIEKVLENGQLIIKVDGVRYTTTGARL